MAFSEGRSQALQLVGVLPASRCHHLLQVPHHCSILFWVCTQCFGDTTFRLETKKNRCFISKPLVLFASTWARYVKNDKIAPSEQILDVHFQRNRRRLYRWDSGLLKKCEMPVQKRAMKFVQGKKTTTLAGVVTATKTQA